MRVRIPPWLRRSEPAILMYHRVANLDIDPWGLAVRPEYFAEQMVLLQRTREPLSLVDFVAALRDRKLSRNAVAVTFDDGYRDNLLNAKPIMGAARVPGTVFLATGSIGDRRGYWWDELAHLIFRHVGAADVEVRIANSSLKLLLGSKEIPNAGKEWRAWEEPRNEREQAYIQVWQALRNLNAADRDAAMRQIRTALSPGSMIDEADLPMTKPEIKELVLDGPLEIGCHTSSHIALPVLQQGETRREIEESKRVCEQLAGKPVLTFAYPYGALDDRSRDLVETFGFEAACSTQSGPVRRDKFDHLALPRIPVGDWNGRALARALESRA